MTDIVLTTLNARYPHASFGLRYLYANMGALQARTKILEFVISDPVTSILSEILEHEPKIVGIGVYIWNVVEVTQLVADLKRLRPDILVIVGGPEVSYEAQELALTEMADYVISGDADLEFARLCQACLSGTAPREPKFMTAQPPKLEDLVLPYDWYDEEDIAHRVLYVEASRGCPFTCEFCLSSLEIPVRAAPLDGFLASMQMLLDRGAKQLKFVDRTFNLNLRVSQQILQFFLDRYQPGMFLHFEMIPDRLPESLRALIAKFPTGSIQLEIGVQTFNPEVGLLISRRQDNEKLADNFRYLREQTGVHIHADLIVGLPGEDCLSFAKGFDQLYRLRPQEIQVGILKRLRGTPITRHDGEWEMKYSQHPPYEVLSTKLMDFVTIHRLRRFARYWDLIGNSGNFVETLELLMGKAASPFEQFSGLCDWLQRRDGRTHGIALIRLYELLFEFLCQKHHDGGTPLDSEASPLPERPANDVPEWEQRIAMAMWQDYTRGGRRDRPHFLRRFDLPTVLVAKKGQLPIRQARHATPES